MNLAVFPNFNSCCRLCLVEKTSTLSNIYSSRNESCGIVEKIYSVTGIKITSSDRISTNLCDKCFLLINNFDNFKTNCLANQQKLTKRLHNFDELLLNESIQIKDEPPDQDDDDVVFVSNDEEISVKVEVLQPPLDITVDCREDDLPPLLSPNLPTAVELPNNIESSVANEDYMDESQSVDTNDNEQVEPAGAEQIIEGQREKIDFAAGLQLQSKITSSVNLEPMTKAELQYTKKHILIYSQFQSLRCSCHNEKLVSRKSLLAHVKRHNSTYLPPYSCLACISTLNGPSAYHKHKSKECKKKEFEGLYQIFNAVERDVNKHRSYQMFTCEPCGNHYRIYEEYCKHAERHVLELNLHCSCGKDFNNATAFKQHVYNTCLVKYTCDICHKKYDTVEAFKEHCTTFHDDDEGPQFNTENGFVLYEFPIETLYACVECNLKCAKSQVMIKHLQSEHIYDAETAKRVSADCYIGPRSDDDNNISINNNGSSAKQTSLRSSSKTRASISSKSAECDICSKSFGSHSNMLRHKQQVHDLKRRGNVRCGDCKEKFANVAELQAHLESHHSFPCVECRTKYKTFEELDKHRSIHLKISLTRDPATLKYRSNSRSCDICNHSFQTEEELNQHMQAHVEDMPSLESVEQQDVKDLKMQCKLCKRLFATRRGLNVHLAKQHPEAIIHRDEVNNFPKICDVCGETIRDINAWLLHMKMHPQSTSVSSNSNSPARPDDTDYYTCKKCFKVFATKSNYRQHMRVHGIFISPPKSRYCCSICKVTCTTQADWLKHKQTHVKKITESVSCKYCKASFNSSSDLEKHIRQEHEITLGKFDCNICGKKLYSVDSLRGHIGWHKRPSKYMINPTKPPPLIGIDEESPKVNMNPPKLNINPKDLFKNKTYVCITCGDLFPHHQELQAHISTSHGSVETTSVRCASCNTYFSSATELKEHEKTHIANNIKQDPAGSVRRGKVSQCKTCSKIFQRTDHLQAHMEKVHPELLHLKKGCTTCPYCKMNFQKQNALISHIKMHKRRNDKLPSKPIDYKFNCSICGRGFNIPAELRSHIIAQHPF